MTRRIFRTINGRAHVEALKRGDIISFETACAISGQSRFVLTKKLGPNGAPFFRMGKRLFIAPAALKVFLDNLRRNGRI